MYHIHKVYQQVALEFNETMALNVCLMLSINLTTKVTKKDIRTPGRYTGKILKKAKSLFHSLSDDEFDEILAIWEVLNSWSIGQELQGLGGSQPKTLKQLITEKTTHSLNES